MPNVMIRQDQSGKKTLYVAKRDLEEDIVSIEFEAADRWGGDITLADGSTYYIEPLDVAPDLPITIRAKRGGEG
ncbi:putative nitrogen fixation protein NifT [Ketobacter sp.]|uniref:putative nitrogen fixation protein NifT n=1 Tax=Ketobacter sp. TaxID=2083498 RepID=UPI000F1FB9B1|nr:putative nitrogen fixation protein NifT [Ketobacter sp.]MEE2730217.1 putative nitrogen fixation protein NifT [Pseudomonadota bacterium]RLU02027.1 MAG: putative nitrogen fixation protein NifT [Ketobacter sp.]